ncbi:MAG: hypothetical protein IJO74_05185 [Clostridia bacterium]|nr:hypothetical protein [Clostridia bacterium]
MIKRTTYKDRDAISIECKHFSAIFLPLDGAKMASFKTENGTEIFAQAPGQKYKRLFLDSDYVQSECSAFDDMFPTIDPCTINGFEYLDHGEACRREHNIEVKDDKVYFTCFLPSLNITYRKIAYIENDALLIKYIIENHNDIRFPYIWAAHIMLRGETGAYAVSNFPKDSEIKVVNGNPTGDVHFLPDVGNKNYKFYYTDTMSPLKCGVVYPKSKIEVDVEFDNDVIKYFGVWVNPGDLNKMYNIAIEPCSAPYDSPINAERENVCSYLMPKEMVEFTLKMSYKNLV